MRKNYLLSRGIVLSLLAIGINVSIIYKSCNSKQVPAAEFTITNSTFEVVVTETNSIPDLIEIGSTIEWMEVKVDDFSDFDPYTPEERAKFKADQKRRGRSTFGLEIANDGTNLVLVTHDYSARDGSNKRLIYPLTNRFVQMSFYFNGEIEVSRTNSSIREVEGNLNLSEEDGFWIDPNQPYREGFLHRSNITIIHMTGDNVKSVKAR